MEKNFNELTPAQTERLAILLEECSEVIQIIGKILRHGYHSYNPKEIVEEGNYPTTNKMLLEKELGDVENVVRMMINSDDIRMLQIKRHADEKAKKISKYLHHQQ